MNNLNKSDLIRNSAVFITVGILVGVFVFTKGVKFLSDNLVVLILLFAIVFLITVLTWWGSLYFKKNIISKLTGFNTNSNIDIELLLTAIEEKNFKVLKKQSINGLKEVKSFIVWFNYQRIIFQTFTAIIIGFGGILGTVLLYNQNTLLQAQENQIKIQNSLIEIQNEKVQNQTYLLEADRRAALIFLMNNVLDKIDEELKGDYLNDNKRNLSPELIGRIIALSQSFLPYRFLDEDEIIESPVSPERGQLLLNLVNSQLDSMTYREIFEKSIFESSLLKNANLNNAYLYGINMKNSNLFGASLENSTIENSNFDGSILNFASLRNSRITNSSFLKSNMQKADLSLAELSIVKLDDAVMVNANLYKTKIQSCTAINTNFHSVIAIETDFGVRQSQITQVVLTDEERREKTLRTFKETNFHKDATDPAARVIDLINRRGTRLDGADFNASILIRTNFSSTSFDKTNLGSSIVEECDFSSVINLFCEQFENCTTIYSNKNIHLDCLKSLQSKKPQMLNSRQISEDQILTEWYEGFSE